MIYTLPINSSVLTLTETLTQPTREFCRLVKSLLMVTKERERDHKLMEEEQGGDFHLILDWAFTFLVKNPKPVSSHLCLFGAHITKQLYSPIATCKCKVTHTLSLPLPTPNTSNLSSSSSFSKPTHYTFTFISGSTIFPVFQFGFSTTSYPITNLFSWLFKTFQTSLSCLQL